MTNPFAPPEAELQEQGRPSGLNIRNAVGVTATAWLGPLALILILAHWMGTDLSTLRYQVLIPIVLVAMPVAGIAVIPFRRLPLWLALMVGPILGLTVFLGLAFIVYSSERLL